MAAPSLGKLPISVTFTKESCPGLQAQKGMSVLVHERLLALSPVNTLSSLLPPDKNTELLEYTQVTGWLEPALREHHCLPGAGSFS